MYFFVKAKRASLAPGALKERIPTSVKDITAKRVPYEKLTQPKDPNLSQLSRFMSRCSP